MNHNIFATNEYVRDIQDSFRKIKEIISTLQQKQKRDVDKHRWPLEFKPDDQVLLRFSKARLIQATCKDWQGNPQDIKSSMPIWLRGTMVHSKFWKG